MLLNVANRSPLNTYWPASIVMPCGQLLRLRPIGCDDAARDFWCDVTSADVRPISSCHDGQPDICPPDGIFLDQKLISYCYSYFSSSSCCGDLLTFSESLLGFFEEARHTRTSYKNNNSNSNNNSNNKISTIRPTSISNVITSSPLQRPLSASRCGARTVLTLVRSATPLRQFGTHCLLISQIILTTCFYLVLNAASKRTSTNFHS